MQVLYIYEQVIKDPTQFLTFHLPRKLFILIVTAYKMQIGKFERILIFHYLK